MAVAFDATFTGATTDGLQFFTAGTSVSSTKLTVGAGTNRALVVMIQFLGANAVNPPTSVSVTWDSGGTNQAMTLISSVNNDSFDGGNGLTQQIWGLINPINGNKTLAAAWTGSNTGALTAVSVTGANQTGGTTTFNNASSAQDLIQSNPASVTITSSATGFVVAQFAGRDSGDGPTRFSSVNNTGIFFSFGGAIAGTTFCAANRAGGAASVTMTATADANCSWMAQGVNITQAVAAPSAGRDFPNPSRRPSLAFGHTDSFKLPLQQVLPPRQTDWPVPIGRTLFADWIFSNVAARPPLIFPVTQLTEWPNPVLPRPPLNVGSTDSFKLPSTQQLPTFQTDWPNPVLPRPPLNVGSTESFKLSYQQVLPPRLTEWPNPRGPLPIFRDWTASFNLSSGQTLPPGSFNWPNVVRARSPVVSDWIYPANHTLILPPPVISRARMYDWPVPRGPRRSIDLLTTINQIMRAPPGPPIAGGPREFLKNETGRVRTLKNERLRVRWLTKLP